MACQLVRTVLIHVVRLLWCERGEDLVRLRGLKQGVPGRAHRQLSNLRSLSGSRQKRKLCEDLAFEQVSFYQQLKTCLRWDLLFNDGFEVLDDFVLADSLGKLLFELTEVCVLLFEAVPSLSADVATV